MLKLQGSLVTLLSAVRASVVKVPLRGVKTALAHTENNAASGYSSSIYS